MREEAATLEEEEEEEKEEEEEEEEDEEEEEARSFQAGESNPTPEPLGGISPPAALHGDVEAPMQVDNIYVSYVCIYIGSSSSVSMVRIYI